MESVAGQTWVTTDTPSHRDASLRWEERAEQIWYSTDPLPGTLGETYLRSRCCYVETAWDIRFLKPSINYRPAVVGRITDFESGDPMSLVFIDLDSTGQKIRKRNLPGYPVAKGVVRLSANEPVDGTLGVAEGIETALSVIAAEKGPCWATLGTANMRKLPVLNRYGTLTLNIWGDNGEPGKEAAEELAERWTLSGHVVRPLFPNLKYGDWNDFQQTSARAQLDGVHR